MTSNLAPGSPKLKLDGEEQDGDKIADSSWEGVDEPTQDEETAANLGRIARTRKAKSGTPRAKG